MYEVDDLEMTFMNNFLAEILLILDSTVYYWKDNGNHRIVF